MSTVDYIWLIVIVFMVMPVLQQKVLRYQRRYLISSFESKRDSRVITMVHRQEAMKFFGIPLYRYIDINDSEEVIRAVNMTDDDVPVDLILHTPGGLVLASLQIARAIKKHSAKVTVFVPHMAMSGGTLIALAADEIVMGRHAFLGPVDPQIQEYPAASILETIKTKPLSELEDETLILGDVAGKAVVQIRHAVNHLLPESMPDGKAKKLADLLSRGAWTHDYPLQYEHLEEFELNVSEEIPDEVYELLSYYSQPTQQSTGVEFTPTPRKKSSENLPGTRIMNNETSLR
ncbi:MAG: ATP-dependent Clp protease proteolytic subunit [bacterium]